MTTGVRVNCPHSRLVGGPCPWDRRRCRTAKGRSWQTGTETQHKVQTMVNTCNASIFITMKSTKCGQYLLRLNLFHIIMHSLWSISPAWSIYFTSQSFSQNKPFTSIFSTKYRLWSIFLPLNLYSTSFTCPSTSQHKSTDIYLSIYFTTQKYWSLPVHLFHNRKALIFYLSIYFTTQKYWSFTCPFIAQHKVLTFTCPFISQKYWSFTCPFISQHKVLTFTCPFISQKYWPLPVHLFHNTNILIFYLSVYFIT